MAADPGASGVVPFRFACHRCGNCCTHGEGYIWLSEGEEDRLAGALGLSPEAFVHRFVIEVPDPKDGKLRRSLRTESGRCLLLEGANHCGAYGARPEHCRSFPYWSSVLEDAAGFERARSVCPGIEPELDEGTVGAALAELAAWIAEDTSSPRENRREDSEGDSGENPSCPFPDAGTGVWVTGLEAELLGRIAPSNSQGSICPWHRDGACGAVTARPHACRAALGDGDVEGRLAKVRDLEQRHGIPTRYTAIRTRRTDRVQPGES